MNNELEFKITEDALQALFQGQKVEFRYQGLPAVILLPPRYGVFMTYEKVKDIERAAYMQAWEKVLDIMKSADKGNKVIES